MSKSAGLNSVSTYVFWNLHQPQNDRWNFEGNADIAEFCRLAQAEGLKVIIRPGPYVCSEWEMGGLPWWLLKEPGIRLRSSDPRFLEATRKYFLALGKELADLQVHKGGPIIMVQVENEYDGFGRDEEYINQLCSYLKEAGFEVPFFTSEMGWSMRRYENKELLRTVGVGRNPQREFARLRRIQPDKPLMSGEFYTGWFDQWGRGSSTRSGHYDSFLENLTWMLENDISFNLYMAHGGTTFGFYSGANDGPYLPQPTSYDYGAPISEAGWATPKYHAIREILAKYSEEPLPEIPERPPVVFVPSFEFKEVAPMLANLPEGIEAIRPRPMEFYDQGHGCILYRTKLPPGGHERLVIRELHDYGVILLNGEKIATLDRRLSQDTLLLPERSEEATLDILVEAMGRINFGKGLHDHKGITEKVNLVHNRSLRELTGWEVFSLPMDEAHLARLSFQPGKKTEKPAFYRGSFVVRDPGDTFLDMRTWGKGVVWVNGHNLGRFWDIGPQQTLYCPGPWLKEGENEIIVFDIKGPDSATVTGLTEPILDELNLFASGRLHRKPEQNLELDGKFPAFTGAFSPGSGWKQLDLLATQTRYLCLEALNSHSEDAYATCAELEVMGKEGEALPPTKWKILYASSEELQGEDGSARNVLDGKSATFWHTQWQEEQPEHPHHIVIDLGEETEITGIRYLPRQDLDHGRIKEYKLYFSKEIFSGI